MTLQEELEAEAKSILLLPHPWCGERPASSLVVSLVRALNGLASSFERL